MLKTANCTLENISLQRVGNKYRKEINMFADQSLHISPEEREIFKKFFLGSLKSNTEIQQFSHHIDLSYNLIFSYVEKYFSGEIDFITLSNEVLKHLYEKSNHAQIKPGELFITLFNNIEFEDVLTNAIGIYKIERKTDFLNFKSDSDALDFEIRKGVKLQKIDKGCIITNTHKDTGYRVVSYDNNSYDTTYWTRAFLDIDFVKNNAYQTKHHLSLLSNFASTLEENDNYVQKDFINQGVKIFNENEFITNEILNEELLEPFNAVDSFKDFKENFKEDYKIELEDNFCISPETLIKETKKIKTEISLDTKIKIKVDINEADVLKDNVEKGYDEDRRMHYYKVFYNEEI